MMEVEILKDKKVLDFIDTHASVLDSTFEKVKMSNTMRSSLQQSNWVFSGMKTFHELKEAFPSLLDENGEKKPFERFLKDVQRVDETYNRNYLRAEYNFVSTSAEMAARWEEFEKDGDRYFLQYRTVGDDRVRQEHAALEGTTLPVEHPFWDTHYPPNGWNCRCNVVQVRKSRYPATSEDELIERKKALAEEQARHKGKSEMFRFNPGKQRKTFPDYNPYTIKRCGDCDIAKGNFAKVEESELCAGCMLLRKCRDKRGCDKDAEFGERLLISRMAHKADLANNLETAHILLRNFPEMYIKIREHITGNKNPEYLINGEIGDRKGIEGTNGVTSGFKKAIHQGCKIVVIDLNEHLKDKKLQTHNLAKELANRFRDFHDGIISDCYIIYHDKAIRLDVEDMPTDPTLTKGKDKGIRQAHIEDLLQKIAT